MIQEASSKSRATVSHAPQNRPWFRQRRVRRWAPFIILAVAFLLQWSLLMNVLGPTWDAAFYYSYARSLAFDQDLSIENDLELSYPTASADFVARELHNNQTSTGHVYAPFAIGSALLWLPLLAILRLGTTIFGLPVSTGFEWYFAAPLATFSALSAFVAFCAAYWLAAREAGRTVALLAALTMSFATPLIYYQFREPLYAHVPSALLNTLLLVVWWRAHRQIPSAWQGAAIGALLALAALMRWQNAIYAVLPLISAGWTWLRLGPDERRARIPRLLVFLATMGGAFLFVFSPQLFVWQQHYGSWFTIPQGSDFMVWRAPLLQQLLFSPFRGLLPWMPLFALASIGLLVKARSRPRLVVPLVILLLLSTYVNASSRDWFAGGGYGPRRSAGEMAIFVLGYAWLLSVFPARLRLLLGAGAGVALAFHQWLLLRFALAERIGGRVLSMAPDFAWAEVSAAEFVAQLAAHIPDIFRRPLDVFVFPGSPLHHALQNGGLPLRHVVALLVAGTFLAICLLLIGRARSWLRSSHLQTFLQ